MFCRDPALFWCPLLASSENKEEVQLQMSSCKVIKLIAWGPVLLGAGQQGRVGVHNRSSQRDLQVLTSFHPLVEVALPHVAVQVVTLWAQGPRDVSWGLLAPCTEPRPPGCIGHWDATGSATRGHGGCLREGFVYPKPMNQLIKGKAVLPRTCAVGGRKERDWLGFM